MSYTNNPASSVVDRLRLKVGDIDETDEGLTDEVYEYLYESKAGNENQAALEALRMLVFKYANYVTEKSGAFFIKEGERYTQYKAMLEQALKDPSFGFFTAGTGYAGGISKGELQANRMNSDANGSPFREGATTSLPFDQAQYGRYFRGYSRI